MPIARTVLVIPAEASAPMYMAYSTGYEDLNALAKCEVGTVSNVESFYMLDGKRKNGRIDLWVDDMGLLVSKPHNIRASIIGNQPLVGDTVLVATDEEGESQNIDQAYIKSLLDNSDLFDLLILPL